eukprot:3229007-Rhodomonas_salina.1
MSTQQAEEYTESVKKESYVYHVRLDGLNLDIDAREKGSETSFINTHGASSEGNNAMFVEVRSLRHSKVFWVLPLDDSHLVLLHSA